MKKKYSLAALLLSVHLCTVSIAADVKPQPDWWETDGSECGNDLEWCYDDETRELIITGSGPMWDFDEKDTPWYWLCETAEHIRIDDRVTYIGNHAFPWMVNVRTVKMPAALEKIGEYAFEECWELCDISFPEGLTEIGNYAFYKCNLSTAALPDSLKTIGDYSFSECMHLTRVQLPDGIESVGESCFAECRMLKEINFPETLSDIGEDILEGDSAWFRNQTDDFAILGNGFLYRYFGEDTDVVIPDTVNQVGRRCFFGQAFDDSDSYLWEIVSSYKRNDITSVIFPDTVTELPEGLLSNIESLESVDFGNSISSLPRQICTGDNALKSVHLPKNLNEIGEEAFNACLSLSSLDVPETVQSIGRFAFDKNPWLQKEGDYIVLGDGLLYQYQGEKKIVTVPDGIKAVCSCAFINSDAVSVTLPDSVRRIYPQSFMSNALVDVTLNEGLTEIPENAFSVSQQFEFLTIPESVSEIRPEAVTGCTAYGIIGKAGSFAEKYARSNYLDFYEEIPQIQGPDKTMDSQKDCWSFTNSLTSFGGINYLSEEDQALLSSYQLSSSAETEWSGACFGMSISAILAKNGLFSAQMIDRNAESLGDLSPSPALLSMINFYQLTQRSLQFRSSTLKGSRDQQIYRMIRTAAQIPHGASPFLICFETDNDGKHAVVGYGTETGEWTFSDRIWTHRILIYDPNSPGFSDERCLYYDPETFALCLPHYGFLSPERKGKKTKFFTVCTDMDVLNAYPYPFADRFKADQSDYSAADAETLKQYLLKGIGISEAEAAHFDLDGNSVLNAADLSLLRRKISA